MSHIVRYVYRRYGVSSLSKKRRVEGKGKVATPNSGVAESVTMDVLRDILKELKGLRMEVGDLRAFAQRTMTMAENGWRTQRQISTCVADLRWNFVPDDDDDGSAGAGTEYREGSGVGAEDKEDGRDGAENEGMRDAEMEGNGADMADNAMDETLH